MIEIDRIRVDIDRIRVNIDRIRVDIDRIRVDIDRIRVILTDPTLKASGSGLIKKSLFHFLKIVIFIRLRRFKKDPTERPYGPETLSTGIIKRI